MENHSVTVSLHVCCWCLQTHVPDGASFDENDESSLPVWKQLQALCDADSGSQGSGLQPKSGSSGQESEQGREQADLDGAEGEGGVQQGLAAAETVASLELGTDVAEADGELQQPAGVSEAEELCVGMQGLLAQEMAGGG